MNKKWKFTDRISIQTKDALKKKLSKRLECISNNEEYQEEYNKLKEIQEMYGK